MNRSHPRSRRALDTCNVVAMATAARWVETDWSETSSIGYAGTLAKCADELAGVHVYERNEAPPASVAVFQIITSDGSRFIIGADRWGNRYDLRDRLDIADALDVEAHA